jgi:hypothetical protein
MGEAEGEEDTPTEKLEGRKGEPGEGDCDGKNPNPDTQNRGSVPRVKQVAMGEDRGRQVPLRIEPTIPSVTEPHREAKNRCVMTADRSAQRAREQRLPTHCDEGGIEGKCIGPEPRRMRPKVSHFSVNRVLKNPGAP